MGPVLVPAFQLRPLCLARAQRGLGTKPIAQGSEKGRYPGNICFHLLRNIFLFSPVGFKGNLSLREIWLFVPGVLGTWKYGNMLTLVALIASHARNSMMELDTRDPPPIAAGHWTIYPTLLHRALFTYDKMCFSRSLYVV